ncbi:MAG TPA: EamA family transporter [Polyangiaceae bacterium]|nr:EamA family transporter [Polyangiaceae bacterium]
MGRSSLNYWAIAAAAASWGTWSAFLRFAQAERSLPPSLSTFVVLAAIAVVLLPLAVREARRAPARGERDWYLLAAFGVCDALNCSLYFAALQSTSVTVATLTHYLAPLLVALVAPIVLKEVRRPGTGAAVTLSVLGLLVLLAPWRSNGADALPMFPGALLGAASAVFFAAGVLFNKHLSQRFGPAELIVYHVPSALLVLGLMVPEGGWSISATAFAWLVAGAIGPGALAGVVFVRALSQVPAARASVLTFIEPLTAVTIATLLWEQPCGAHSLLGGGAILTAGYWVMRERPPVYAAPSSARA